MHSHDRTMLAKFGFADPDHNNSKHDLACLYLCQEITIKKILPYLYRKNNKVKSVGSNPDLDIGDEPITEYHITKGEGQYKTTIGFIDVFLQAYATSKDSCKDRNCCSYECHHIYDFNIGLEVKINPVPVGDILRQIAFYKTYATNIEEWAVVTSYPLSSFDSQSLKNQGIFHFRLGDSFEKWLSEQSQSEPPAPIEL